MMKQTQKLVFKGLLAITLLALGSCAKNKPISPSDRVQAKPKTQQAQAIENNNQTSAIKSPTITIISKIDKEQYAQGVAALNNNELDKAQALFARFIKNNPKRAEGYASFALIYFKKNQYKKALKHINTALELNPKLAQAYNIRAQILIKNGHIHKAKNDYLMAIKLKPNYSKAHYNLALLYDIYLQEIELAINHYNQYLNQLQTPDKATQEWVSHLKGILKNG